MRVLIDTDVVLDLMLKRAAFFADAFAVWKAGDQGRYERYVAAMTPVNAFYIARKFLGAPAARLAVGELLAATKVCDINAYVLTTAYSSSMADFEDAVQVAAAQAAGIDAIVTRNGADYTGAPMLTLTPMELLSRLMQTPEAPGGGQ
ncbi:PIN domain-containing protein [Candidatus Chloroploca sp. M-50]|uniref:PIN domain-containing protein n=1 Tax=Candidatus Chloroploca mongolica TaxID=2528176 RepID=A0ABS4D6F8_9CHLR|nr:PIN domain-containing protein [Candidatus Chloroploca mongolica]MBP1465021.1 PIN domain-containing protein [Candidatus Chloroploca mongolica]